MSETMIQVEGLGKRYIISHENRAPYSALRDVISDRARKLVSGKQKITKEEFWALQEISFEIKKGEAVGIIGRNGAGKSTLLKILSRITEPTTGSVKLFGRVTSLLEVGTGFHQELTGRENIFLNGAILGMRRSEVKKKFDEIVSFSGVEKFLDTPVKRYSSGMYVRLAFAIAAHLEPEILLVDEVLAVGDAEFQRKCLGKMDEVSRQDGRTILFVSHNMEAISKFCSRSVLLDNGSIKSEGPTREVIESYLQNSFNTQEKQTWDTVSHQAAVRIRSAWVHNADQQIKPLYAVTEKIGISFEYEVLTDDSIFTHGINVNNGMGINIFNSHDVITARDLQKSKKGIYRATAWIPANLLPEEIFSVGLALFSPNPFVILEQKTDALVFRTYDDMQQLSARGNYLGEDFGGLLRPLLEWNVSGIS